MELHSVVPLNGMLHVYVAFDWGDEVDLDRAHQLVPAELLVFPRRRRTPTSIAYRPPPLRLHLGSTSFTWPELGRAAMVTEVTLFDFAGVSIAFHVPFQLSASALHGLAGWLAESGPLIQLARSVLEPLHQKLLPAIHHATWREDFSEEYFVFQLPPGSPEAPLGTTENLVSEWLAGLVRLESGPLSIAEVAEATRLQIGYSPADLFVADWAAAVLFDRDCDETLQTIEFANLQLLEYRYIDNRLDERMLDAYGLLHALVGSWLPLWRSYSRSLRALGELKLEANVLFERTGNVLKLVGDQYLARVYRLLAARFHLEAWEHSIQRKLEVAEGAYRVVSDQAATSRMEVLEIVVVLLILLEIILTFSRVAH
jgi:hypothetical protein